MKKSDVIRLVLGDRLSATPRHTVGKAFAPTNIALCKYWGKRDQELNLPQTGSLSISLGDKGAIAELSLSERMTDEISFNGQAVDLEISFSKRLLTFLNLFYPNQRFHINIKTNIPMAAGLASSACGFASIVQALDRLYGWELSQREQSILARLGSGSASRSVYSGFVEWHAGVQADGMDSYAEPIKNTWPTLCVGLLIMSEREKPISSREAMQRTVATSPLYSAWPSAVAKDLSSLKQAIIEQDFQELGEISESNAMTMHATMLSAWPSITYAIPETLLAMQKIWKYRNEGLPVYFTQDAGPNLKLLFLEKEAAAVQAAFPNVEVILPFR